MYAGKDCAMTTETNIRRRPNFLIFITDQFHPGCTGYAKHPVVRTPNIDCLAASGVNFTRGYTNQPLCMPARATMFTGLTPRGHRVRMNGIPLDATIPTFTEALRQAGYRTHSCGKIHLGCSQPPRGSGGEITPEGQYPRLKGLWEQGRLDEMPLPYYGLAGVDICDGHAITSWGHYVDWLKREHPEEAHLFLDAVPLEPPGPAFDLFNRKYFKWALPTALHPMTWIADRTIDFLDEVGRSQSEEEGANPFCLMCSIQEPHSPFAPAKEYAYRHDPKDVPPPAGREGELDELPPHFRAMREQPITTSGNKSEPMNATDPYRAECAAHYYSLIEMVDDQVGRVMGAVRANGLEEDTVVLFVADHGEALGDHGLWGKGPYHFDSVIRVPYFISWPGHFRSGAIHEGVVSLLDFAPTILDIAGVPIPEGPCPVEPEAPDAPSAWPGRSLVPVLTGEDTSTDSACVVEMDEDYLGFKMRTLVTKRYRLTCYSGQNYGELFDLQEDPDELHNLWDRAEHKALRDELRLQLLDEIMKTDISVPRQMVRA
jgi:arylsulfatase A-like enzyme